jgi:hypothetical protein
LDLLNHFEIIDSPSPSKFEHQIIGTTEDRSYLQNDVRIFYKNHGTHVSAHELQTELFNREIMARNFHTLRLNVVTVGKLHKLHRYNIATSLSCSDLRKIINTPLQTQFVFAPRTKTFWTILKSSMHHHHQNSNIK